MSTSASPPNVTAPDYDEHLTELPLETREIKKRDKLAADSDALLLPLRDLNMNGIRN